MGILHVLQEDRISIDLVVGIRIGSIVGAFYCAGVSVEKPENLVSDTFWKGVSNFSYALLISML
jgi:predicted acylesterase/phospholipase RssA